MKYNPDIHHRKSIRLKGYDHSSEGLYFITICTYQMEHLFGKILNNEMILNEYGKIVEEEILRTLQIRENIYIDNYVIMPNHIHFIIEIVKNDIKNVGAYGNTPNNEGVGKTEFYSIKKLKSPSKNIGSIIRAIKAGATARINEIRNSFCNPVWQRNYYENIIRNEKMYLKVMEYIEDNPLKWDEDRYR